MYTHTVSEKTTTITCKSKLSSDGKYRYTLTRTWDNSEKTAVVIGINPSKATHLKGDNTATNAMNYLVDNKYGKMVVVNLFPYMCTESKELVNRDEKYDTTNLNYIDEECATADIIIVAWGYGKNYKRQKRKVENIIKKYQSKVKCFQNSSGRKPTHLRIYNNAWKLVNYY